MIPWVGPICLLVVIAVLSIHLYVRFRQGVKIGKTLRPMAGGDRLRVALALRMLEDADKELSQAAWINGQPGHPAVCDLLMDVKELEARMRQTLRNR